MICSQRLFQDFPKRGQNSEFRNEGGANMYILDVDTCLSTKFQGGANQIQGEANAPLRPHLK